MTEFQEHFPGMSHRELLETLSPEQLVDYIVELGSRGDEIETEMDLAADVMEKQFGVTVDEALEMMLYPNHTQSYNVADLLQMLKEENNGTN